jgi:hypothetical protein
MTSYDLANERISDDLANNKIDTTNDNINANNYAKNIMHSYEQELNNSHSEEHQQKLQYEHSKHTRNNEMPPRNTMPSMQNQMPPALSQEYKPPVPPMQQPPVPQQSQHMNVNQQATSVNMNGNYTGFDSSDNLSPLDASFNSVKEPIRQRANVNSDPRTNEIVEPYVDETEMFSPF